MTDDTNMPDLAEVYRGRSPEIAKLAAALCKAQAAMGGAKKDSTNPHFKSKYADLGSVWDAVRKPLTDNGLAVVQFPRTTRNGVEVETTLLHVSGEYMTAVLWVPVVKMDAMSLGSAITYGRRYSLMSVAGIAPVNDIPDAGDDDGVGASDPPHKPGVPGSAGGGTDYLPPKRYGQHSSKPHGPKNSSANGMRMANDDEHLIDNTREKGTNGKPAPDERAQKIAAKAAAWTATAIGTLRLTGQTRETLSQFLVDHHEQIRFLEDHAPEQHERFFDAFNAASEAAQARVS